MTARRRRTTPGPLSVGELQAGDVVDCTITNKRKARVKVTKQVVSSHADGGKFDLQVNGSTKEADAQDGGTTGYVNVGVGTNPSVGEVAGSGTTLGDYESSIACSGDSSARARTRARCHSARWARRAVVDCTITNKRKPRVNVTKDLYPSSDTGMFDLKVNGATEEPNAGDGGSTGDVNVAVDSNPTVGEGAGTDTTLSDYASSIECTGDSDASCPCRRLRRLSGSNRPRRSTSPVEPPSPAFGLLGGAVDLEVEHARVAGRIQILGHVHPRLALVRDRAVDHGARAERAQRQRTGVRARRAAVTRALDRRLVVAQRGPAARNLADAGACRFRRSRSRSCRRPGVRRLGRAVDLQVELAAVRCADTTCLTTFTAPCAHS